MKRQVKPVTVENRSTFDDIVKSYIVSCIDSSDRDLEKEPETPFSKVQFLKTCFESEYGHEIKRSGHLKAMINWLQGLPSCLNIEFANYRILELAKSWGSLPENPTENEEDRILDNYWNLMANKTLQLFSLKESSVFFKRI
ncbi:MAG TPA: hypothetical protein PLZ43_08090 [bacterium]|nr:hypothetical protein [bacterium]